LTVIIESISEVAFGCVIPLPGYLKGIQNICNKYGAMLIVDEIMCGTGRIGSLYVWQKENFMPDILLLGKGISGGYLPLFVMMVNSKINKEKIGKFIHGFTYQSMPIQAAVGTTILTLLKNKNILINISYLNI